MRSYNVTEAQFTETFMKMYNSLLLAFASVKKYAVLGNKQFNRSGSEAYINIIENEEQSSMCAQSIRDLKDRLELLEYYFVVIEYYVTHNVFNWFQKPTVNTAIDKIDFFWLGSYKVSAVLQLH